MTTKKSLILKAIAEKKNPSEAHRLLWKHLKKKRFHRLKWLEYQVVQHSISGKVRNLTDDHIVDFYCSKLDWSINISDSEATLSNQSTFSRMSVLNDIATVMEQLNSELLSKVLSNQQTVESSLVTSHSTKDGYRKIDSTISTDRSPDFFHPFDR